MRPLPRGQLYFEPLRVLSTLVRHSVRGDAREVAAFEASCAATLGAPEAVLLPHARIALRELLRSLALPPGGEVLMTPVTIPDIVNVVLDAGLVPVWVDLGDQTANLDVDDLARKITGKSRVLLVTHLCGLPTDMGRVMAIAAAHQLTVLEDVSQAMGGSWGGQPLGTFGLAGFFSLTTLKPLATFHGGLVLTRDPALATRLRAVVAGWPPPRPGLYARLYLRDIVLHASSHPEIFARLGFPILRAAERMSPRYVAEFQRGNFLGFHSSASRARRHQVPERMATRYTAAQAAIGQRSLAHVMADNARRRALAERLLQRLDAAGLPGRPRLPAGGVATWWRFPYWTETPELLRRALREAGIDTAHTNLCCNSAEPAFASFAADTPQAQRYLDGMIFLPMHPNFTEADMDRAASCLERYHAAGGR